MIVEFPDEAEKKLAEIFGKNRWTEKSIETIRLEPRGCFYVYCDGLKAKVTWAKVGRNKYVKILYDYIGPSGTANDPCMWEEYRNLDEGDLESILISVSEKLYERYRRMKTQTLIRCYRADLRLRTGYRTWGEEIDRNRLTVIDDELRFGMLIAERPWKFYDKREAYLITPFGTFKTRHTKVRTAVKMQFGLDLKRFRKPEGLQEAVEEQLRIRGEIPDAFFEFLKGERVLDFDPNYGILTEKIFYPVDKPYNAKILSVRFRSIRELLFGLYGREVPERPDIAGAIEAPPWTIKRFGRKKPYILLDEFRDIIVYLRKIGQKHLYYLNLGPSYGDREYRLKTARTVRAAFREVFGVELPPDATRADVEAIIALRTIGT